MHYKISVLISTYNNLAFVEKKLEEIQRQSIFDEAEFIFIETASPEKERDLLEPFCSKHDNCRLITSDKRYTLYDAWNMGWNEASAQIICNSNMDDTMHPRLLEYVVKNMNTHRWDACSVLIAKQFMDSHWNDWSMKHLSKLELSLRPGPFTAWKRNLKDSIGQFDGRFISAGDKDFWSRLVNNNCSIGLIKKVLYLYTKSEHQLSKTLNDKRKQNDIILINEKKYPSVWSYKIRYQIFWRRYIWIIYPAIYFEADQIYS